MSNDEDDDQPAEQEAQAEDDKLKEEEKKVVIPPTKKGFKNKQGDYVVTTINIPDMRDGLKAEKAAK